MAHNFRVVKVPLTEEDTVELRKMLGSAPVERNLRQALTAAWLLLPQNQRTPKKTAEHVRSAIKVVAQRLRAKGWPT